MNTTAILIAARDIDENTAALKWLEEFGVQLGVGEHRGVSVRLDDLFARWCPGGSEAKFQMEHVADLFIQRIVQATLSRCRMNIDIATQKIATEIAKAQAAPAQDQEGAADVDV